MFGFSRITLLLIDIDQFLVSCVFQANAGQFECTYLTYWCKLEKYNYMYVVVKKLFFKPFNWIIMATFGINALTSGPNGCTHSYALGGTSGWG